MKKLFTAFATIVFALGLPTAAMANQNVELDLGGESEFDHKLDLFVGGLDFDSLSGSAKLTCKDGPTLDGKITVQTIVGSRLTRDDGAAAGDKDGVLWLCKAVLCDDTDDPHVIIELDFEPAVRVTVPDEFDTVITPGVDCTTAGATPVFFPSVGADVTKGDIDGSFKIK